MRKSITGFFMLFVFYIFIGYFFFGIDIDFILFTPFYIFFILILSLIPTLSITYRNVLGLTRSDNVLFLVNTVHISLIVSLIIFAGLYRYFIGNISYTIGYIMFGVSIFVNILILSEDIWEKWFLKALFMYTLAFISLHYYEYFISWNLVIIFPIAVLYLILHNVTILSYGILKLR